jgi:hypothetical protein
MWDVATYVNYAIPMRRYGARLIHKRSRAQYPISPILVCRRVMAQDDPRLLQCRCRQARSSCDAYRLFFTARLVHDVVMTIHGGCVGVVACFTA